MALRALKMAGKWVVGLAGFLVISVACGILGSAVFLPAVAVSTVATETGVKVLAAVPSQVQIPELSERSYMYAADGALLATFYAQNRVIVALDEISQPMQDAIVALEDRRFWEHSGVDVQGMARAFVNNSIDGDIQGASTLTQQFVKNSLIQQAELLGDDAAASAATDRSYARKLREARMAVELEKQHGKKKVLEGFLNIAQFGPSLYGVEAAANYYFGISAKDLTAVQAATIAAVTQAPNALDPENFPVANRARRDDALRAMLRDKYITQLEFDEAIAVDVSESLNLTPTPASCEAADAFDAGFFCDYVVAEILASAAFGEDGPARVALLQRGGLKIHTTLDLAMQNAAVAAIESQVPVGDPSGVGQALSAVEPGTGKIKAMAQNRHYKSGQSDDATYTAINYNVDLAYGGSSGFQPGSTFKPFILAQWLVAGHALQEPFDGSKQNYAANDTFPAKCMDGGVIMAHKAFSIRAGARKNNTAYQATVGSMNASYIAMERKLDLCEIRDLAAAMGVKRADGGELTLVPTFTLGVNEVSPLAMAGAYATFASGGTFCAPTSIESVTDSAGNPIELPGPQCNRVLDEGVANAVSMALAGVVSGGTGTAARLDGRPAAGKTGTTDSSWAAWFVGYTPQLATAVWTGYPDEQKILSGRIGGRWYGEAFGGQLAAPVFARFMDAALAGQEALKFGPVPNILRYGKKINVPSVLGLDARAATKVLEDEGFQVLVSPDAVQSEQYAVGQVAEQDPSGQAYAGVEITLKLSSGPPPAPPPPPQHPPPREPPPRR
ncbi:MAG: transglycosylase domain-containing protein, partial [Bifidobacteriaceae bacterium]|nr:transglycosylase domain-containing protein [Bifidobacteriaceae bacterium]